MFVVPRDVEEETNAVVLRNPPNATPATRPGCRSRPENRPDPKVARDERGDREVQASRRP